MDIWAWLCRYALKSYLSNTQSNNAGDLLQPVLTTGVNDKSMNSWQLPATTACIFCLVCFPITKHSLISHQPLANQLSTIPQAIAMQSLSNPQAILEQSVIIK